MNRNPPLAFFTSIIINLAFHNSLLISVLNSLSLSLVLISVLPLAQKRSSLFPLFALIPLYHFAPRYPAISLLEIFIPLGLILRGRLFFLWIPIIVFTILLQANIFNLPSSFDHERLILPTTEYKLAVKRQIDELLYLPYSLRQPLSVTIGLANSYLTNLFSFITIYNFSQTLLFTNFILAMIGLFSKYSKRLLVPLLLAVLLAGATKQPDKTLFLFTARSTLVYLTWLGINKLNLSPRRYLTYFIIGSVFSLYVWI